MPVPNDGGGVLAVPDVIVRGEEAELLLRPWTACWQGGCYDGIAPRIPDYVGTGESIEVDFPVEGWEFTATLRPLDGFCAPTRTEQLISDGGTKHVLAASGAAGDYEVDLFGRGAGGDVIVSFGWTIPSNVAAAVEPDAHASILANHDGELDSYGVEVIIMNLRAFPTTASGVATVTAEDGSSHSFRLDIVANPCGLGFFFFSAPEAEGLAAAELPGERFTYTIELDFDGETYVGVGVWPDDMDPECEPCVRLEFDPPLGGFS